MVKKRELTVEKWLALMEKDEERRKLVGNAEFVDMHMDMGHDMLSVVYELGIARRWKETGMQVYDFDRDFAESILDEKWSELLPRIIKYRPHDCFYMKLPFNETSEGVVVCIEDVENIIGFDERLFPGARDSVGVHYGGLEKYGERALVNTGKELLCLCPFAIPKGIEHMFDDTQLGKYPNSLVVNGVAYLCSMNADIQPVYVPVKEARRNNAKKRSMATWHAVGYRIGSELRSYNRSRSVRGDETGLKIRPHMRRAHWHHYWIGPMGGERRLVLRWVAPTMVGVKNETIKQATLHKVG